MHAYENGGGSNAAPIQSMTCSATFTFNQTPKHRRAFYAAVNFSAQTKQNEYHTLVNAKPVWGGASFALILSSDNEYLRVLGQVHI